MRSVLAPCGVWRLDPWGVWRLHGECGGSVGVWQLMAAPWGV